MAKVSISINRDGENVLDKAGFAGHAVHLRGVTVTGVLADNEELLNASTTLAHPRGTRRTLDGHLYMDQGLSVFVRVDCQTGIAHAHSNMELPYNATVQLDLDVEALQPMAVA